MHAIHATHHARPWALGLVLLGLLSTPTLLAQEIADPGAPPISAVATDGLLDGFSLGALRAGDPESTEASLAGGRLGDSTRLVLALPGFPGFGGGGGGAIESDDDAGSDSSRRPRQTQGSVTFNFVAYPWSEFRLGDLKESWDDSWRYELNIAGHLPLLGHVEPLAGAYFFFEDREWESSAASVDYDAFGFGVEMGALIYPLRRASGRSFNISLMPFCRIGMGFNDGVFKNVPVSSGFSTGSTGDTRLELTAGAEARVMLFRRVSVGIGGGFSYWESFDVSGGVVDGTGVIIIRNADIAFRGKDAFARVSISILF